MSEVTITVRGRTRRVSRPSAPSHTSRRAPRTHRGGVVERIAALAAPVRADLAERKTAGAIARVVEPARLGVVGAPVECRGQAARPRPSRVGRVHRGVHRLHAALRLAQRRRRAGGSPGRRRWSGSSPPRPALAWSATSRPLPSRSPSSARPRTRVRSGAARVTPLEIADLGLLTGHGDAGGGPQPLRDGAFGDGDGCRRYARGRLPARRPRDLRGRRGPLHRPLTRTDFAESRLVRRADSYGRCIS